MNAFNEQAVCCNDEISQIGGASVEKILSIAVPAFNAERYLDQCLSSMLVSEVISKLDIIVVDDGSTDSTGDIADRYAANYPDSISVIHKENGGHGSGINAAIRVAKGRYFRVVDADDWLLSENLPKHLAELEACDADVVVNSFHQINMISREAAPVTVPAALVGKTISMEQLSSSLLSTKNCFSIQGITYRTKFYAAFNDLLSEKVFYEDSEYITLPFSLVRSIYFSDKYLYQYLIGNAQQSIASANQVKRLDQLNYVFCKICKFYCARPELSESAQQYFHEKLRGVITTYLVTCLLRHPNRKLGKNLAREFISWITENCPPILPIANKEYKKVILLHRLYLSGEVFDQIISSSFYRDVRDRLRK